LGRANFWHLWVEQGVYQVMCFLKHWRIPQSQLGRLLWIAIAWFQRLERALLPHFESKWLQSLHNFLSHCDGRFCLDDYHIPPLQQHGDSYIMDTVLASNLFKPQQVSWINYRRLYLQAITVSDICDGHGNHLEPELYYGRLHEKSGKTTWHCFQQEQPSERSWRPWHKACNLLTSKARKLHTPLGKWEHPIANLRRQ
jgi:hypothetical protein